MTNSSRWQTKNIIEPVGMTAVVLSLPLLANEVRQSNPVAQAATTYEINRDIDQFSELGYSSPEAAALLNKYRNDTQLTDVEARLLQWMARRSLNLWTVQETAYQNVLLTDEQQLSPTARCDAPDAVAAGISRTEHGACPRRLQRVVGRRLGGLSAHNLGAAHGSEATSRSSQHPNARPDAYKAIRHGAALNRRRRASVV